LTRCAGAPAQAVTIIGARDVTANRMVPALCALGYGRADITVVCLTESELSPELRRHAHVIPVKEECVLDEALRQRAPTIIASPTFAHFHQLVALAEARIPFAVEKPIAAARAECEVLRRNGSKLMASGFALSYYTLEKSLPLTYFLNPMPAYKRYLEIDSALDQQTLQEVRDSLGGLRAIEIELLETIANSPSGTSRLWTELPGTLRPFVETTIHPLLVAHQAVAPQPITWTACALGRYGPRAREIRRDRGLEIAPTWIDLRGSAGVVDVAIRTGKYVPAAEARRAATLTFANGEVLCDFDRRDMHIVVRGVANGSIRVRNGGDYEVLMSLFTEFALTGWGAVRTDEFDRQLDALDSWGALCDKAERACIPVVEYENSLPNAVAQPLTPIRNTVGTV
jgi:hypothetical protein